MKTDTTIQPKIILYQLLSNRWIRVSTKQQFGDIKNFKTVNNSVMKKLAVFLIAGVLISLVGIIPSDNIFDLKGIESAKFVMTAEVAQNEELDFVQSGADAIVEIKQSELKEKYQKYSPKSIVLEFEKGKTQYITDFLNLSLASEQEIDGIRIIYGYTSFYKDSQYIDGKKINVMLVEKDDCVLVGFPIIMTGF